MAKDKYSAIWVSHSSIGDYLKCPRAYFLRNIYRDPNTNHKISLMQPALALGQVVHDVIDNISTLPIAERFSEPLDGRFARLWQAVTGKLGGFRNQDEEEKYKSRGQAMIARLASHLGPLAAKTVKIRQELPYFWLSEEENIILCGKIDWLEYKQKEDAVEVIDFKTGKFDEDPESLQLPIYYLLATQCQTKPVIGMKYWYLERDDEPVSQPLPDQQTAQDRIMELARRVALARKLERFVCKNKEGCVACRPYEAIIAGRANHIGQNAFGQDLYTLL